MPSEDTWRPSAGCDLMGVVLALWPPDSSPAPGNGGARSDSAR